VIATCRRDVCAKRTGGYGIRDRGKSQAPDVSLGIGAARPRRRERHGGQRVAPRPTLCVVSAVNARGDGRFSLPITRMGTDVTDGHGGSLGHPCFSGIVSHGGRRSATDEGTKHTNFKGQPAFCDHARDIRGPCEESVAKPPLGSGFAGSSRPSVRCHGASGTGCDRQIRPVLRFRFLPDRHRLQVNLPRFRPSNRDGAASAVRMQHRVNRPVTAIACDVLLQKLQSGAKLFGNSCPHLDPKSEKP
jgi:hypothetical protein